LGSQICWLKVDWPTVKMHRFPLRQDNSAIEQSRGNDRIHGLSVVVVTHNEEQNIRKCLESVRWADDVVVVDDFSTDATLNICREFGVRIFQESWKGFAGQRNSAVEKALHTWILNIDSDERITPNLRDEIRYVLSSDTLKAGYEIPYQNYFRGRWIRFGGWYPDYHVRLFRKDLGRYVDREIHEAVQLNGELGRLKNPLIHEAYRDISSFVRKMDSYSTLMARQYIKEGKRAGPWTGLAHAVYTFCSMFLFRGGFLDGAEGLILAYMYSAYTFLKYAKLIDFRQSQLGRES
jgi:glycosyltransferase involved in cell wall biosynthesis